MGDTSPYPIIKVIIISILAGSIIGTAFYFLGNIDVSSTTFGTGEEAMVIKSHDSVDKYHVTTILDYVFYDEAFENATDFGNRPESRVWLLPHHLLAKELIAGMLNSQADVKNPSTIVIIGPDHLNRASSSLVTTNASWRTPYGTIHPDYEYINEIVETGGAEIEYEPFDEEHSVSGLIPFIHRLWPETKIVPLLIQEDVDPATRRLVADILADDMVSAVVSVDFSHYLPSDISELHDDMSLRVLEQRDYSRLKDLEVDSPASLAFAFDFAEQTASEEFDFYIREDSDSFFGYPVYEGTSYIIGGYTHVPQPTTDKVTLMAFGDMMFSRSSSTFSYNPFEFIAGAENRFFRGVDITIGNLEGTFATSAPPVKNNDFSFSPDFIQYLSTYGFDAVSLANNHSLDQGEAGYISTVELLRDKGISAFGHQEKEVSSIYTTNIGDTVVNTVGVNLIEQDVNEVQIREMVINSASKADYTVAMVHWGKEFEVEASEEQIEWGRKLVDWGADAVVGSHPHVVQGMEVYKSAPILWSLGNFVFDQTFSDDVSFGLAAGISFSPSTTTVRLFPLHSSTTPSLATSSKSIMLKEFFSRSKLDNYINDQTEEAIINISL